MSKADRAPRHSAPASQGPTISVVVCTHNRAALLGRALRDLCEQTLAAPRYEIIVVDNNSSDGTAAVVGEFVPSGLVSYAFEPNQGLSHARNRGWRAARGAYVGYVDDDCRIPPGWLVAAMDVIERVGAGVFGGPYHACYDGPRPAWFQDRYGSHTLGDEPHPLRPGEYLTGGNIFFRRSLLHALGGFDPRLGVSGATLWRGEETALLRRIRSERPGEVIYYHPALCLFHLVRPERMTLRWLVRYRFADGRSSYRVFGTEWSRRRPRLLLPAHAAFVLLALGVDLARSVLWRDRSRYPYIHNYVYERVLRHVGRLGELYERLRSG